MAEPGWERFRVEGVWMLILKKFARDLPALLGLLIVLAIVVIAAIGPWIAPHPATSRPRICCSA